MFYKIVNGDIPSSEVYSDKRIMAFMDIQPVNPGHILIIPKMHARNLQELDPDVGAHMFKLVIRVAEALKKSGVNCEGVNVHLADGEVAGQVVPHIHIHIIPNSLEMVLVLNSVPAMTRNLKEVNSIKSQRR